ncbi:hypothetical protein ACFWPX_36280 [Nocardia sp. NPDC058518]|uniref:hypothetical protein n=1 Tax=Nocardia sp. NPDC058518 TaxID=3346534 RepID=UPI0036495AC8
MTVRRAQQGWSAAAIAIVATIASGCGLDEGAPSSQETTQRAPKTTQEPQPWTAVTDGTWTAGDNALGQPVLFRYSDYAITVVSPPVLTTDDDGETITMSSLIKVERVKKLGEYQPLDESDYLSFAPGNESYPRHDEVYGDDVDLACGELPRQIGETADCVLAFTAPADEIQNSYWRINRSSAAAWPSQLPTPR